ncbi:MAG TPA: transposase, partial [Archangium sp.]|nr:transposase [Archangium sp.]
KLPDWVALFAQVNAGPEGAEHLVVVIRYLLWVEKDAAVHAAARRVLHSVLDEQRAEELMGTWAEDMIERGVQKGLEKGLAQGRLQERAEAVLRILTARGVQTDESARQRILTCTDGATLDRWFDLALHATTLGDVLDELAQ